jgi:hypothetical protein
MSHTLVTLVLGSSPAEREQAVARLLSPGARQAVILEGMPDCNSPLPASSGSALQIARIAAGCPCCAGNIVMKVHLHRMLRLSPQHLYIALARPDHAAQLRRFLQQPPYDSLLGLTVDVAA